MRFKPKYKQLTIDGFRSSLEGLDKSNRWVWLGDHLPWDEFDRRYKQTLNPYCNCVTSTPLNNL